MTAPNIVSVTSIVGKTNVVALSTTSATSVLSNAASSGKVLKINSLLVSNVSAGVASITIGLYSAAALGGTATRLASTIAVPTNASLIVVTKDSYVYVEEDRSIGATASVADALEVVCSYEEIN
jgi:hypothetical protein